MGFMDFMRNAQEQQEQRGKGKSPDFALRADPVTYGEESWRDGRLLVEKHREMQNGDTYISYVEPPDIVEARKTLKRVKDVKLQHSKSERAAIIEFTDAGDEGGLGELVREPSKSGVCHYRAMYKGKDIGLMPAESAPQVKQAYGLYDHDEWPERAACKIVLRDYDGNGWSAATIL
jgi:hypothetical protein